MRAEVEVLARSENGNVTRGTGLALGGDLILTPSFVVDEAESLGIRKHDSEAFFKCEVLAANPDREMALIKVVDTGWDDSGIDELVFGEVGGDVVLTCSILGFTRSITTDEPGRTSDSWQVMGEIAPLSFSRSGQLSIRVGDPPSRAPSRGRSPWWGMAGAPVRVNGVVVGLVVSAHSDNLLGAERISHIMSAPNFKPLLERAPGYPPVYEPIGRSELVGGTVEEVIEGVAKADANNIQQVAALQIALSKAYYERVLSQAKSSFVAALVSALIGFAFFLGAVAFILLKGSIDASIITTISGAILEVIAGLNFWLYSQSSKQLDNFHLRLDRVQRGLVGNSLATGIGDSTVKDQAIVGLVTAMTQGEKG
jgi:hypothetical protein